MEDFRDLNDILGEIPPDLLKQLAQAPAVESDEVDLNKESCSPELWEELGGDMPDVDDKYLPF